MMNNKKNRKIPLMIYPCIVGFCLFLTSASVGCFVTQSGVSFIILAGFAVFVLLSFIQIKILDKMQSMRETVLVFNLLLFIKTAVIFCMFLFRGAFGNIHYGDFVHIFHTCLLFGCVLFIIANFYFEKICLINAVLKNGGRAMLKDSVPKFLRLALNCYPLIFSAFIFATVIIFILAEGVVGPLWLLSTFIVYSLLNAVGYVLLLGENKLLTVIFFVFVSLAKYAVAFSAFLVFVPSASVGETRVFYKAYTVFEYIDLCLLSMSIIADAFAVFYIFRELKRNLRKEG